MTKPSNDGPGGVNINTLLLTIVLALSGWTLHTVVEMGTTLATTVEKVNGHDRELQELRGQWFRDRAQGYKPRADVAP